MIARALAGAALLAVAACGQPETNVATPDIGNAASEAQADIDGYAANTASGFTPPGAPTPAPLAQRSQAITPEDALANDAVADPGRAVARR